MFYYMMKLYFIYKKYLDVTSLVGKPILIFIPDLSQSYPYHTPNQNPNLQYENTGKVIGIASLSLEPQTTIKLTKRGMIVGVVLDCYYKQIS